MYFAEGSEANAVTRSFRLYGAVPIEAYPGVKSGQPYHTHVKMFAEMDSYLKNVKATNAWDEAQIISTIKSILNHYLGEPPTSVTVNGKQMSPKDYVKNVLKLNMDDYIEVMSLMSEPYYTKAEYKVPDNWWHSKDYYNVPLDDFMKGLKGAIRNGYTISIGGDVSEPGFDPGVQAAMVPSFDVPSEFIDEGARQLRFNNGSTTDDHGVHMVGYVEQDGKDWYLIKDSGAGSRNCGKDSKCFGFYFFHEDYVKLKMMNYTVHKDAIKDLLSKFK
jgi:bleomycin hydrolase